MATDVGTGINKVWAVFKPAYIENNLSLRDFSNEWKLLTEKDREQIRGGIFDGTMNY